MLLLFVVLPIISFYYLTSGSGFYKRQMAQLEVKGQLDADSFTDSLVFQFIKNNVTVAMFIKEGTSKEQNKQAELVFKEFKKRKDVRLLSFSEQKGIQKIDGLDQDRYMYLDENSLHYQKAFQLTDKNDAVALIDRTGQIRNFYYLDQEDERNKLITHISMIMPRDKGRIQE